MAIPLQFACAIVATFAISASIASSQKAKAAGLPAANGLSSSYNAVSTTATPNTFVDAQTLGIDVDASKSGLYDLLGTMYVANHDASNLAAFASRIVVDGATAQAAAYSTVFGPSYASTVTLPGQVQLSPGHHTIELQVQDNGRGVTALNAQLIATGFNLIYTPGDVNHDGIVNGLDIAKVSSNWLLSGPVGSVPGDSNGNGVVNGLDIALISSNWLRTSGGATNVPEPSTVVLAVLGGLALLACHHRR